jgi:hypothetical protein
MPTTDLERTPSKSQLRWFGLVVLAFFALVGALLRWQFQLLLAAQILWGTGLTLALLYYWVRPLRLPLYLLWMRAVAPIGWLVSHLVLAAIYYLILTPIAIVMRAFGRDQLRLRFDASARSYWKEHDPAADTARYFRQS